MASGLTKRSAEPGSEAAAPVTAATPASTDPIPARPCPCEASTERRSVPERPVPSPVTCSVIIPTYNRADWLLSCVRSIRRGGIAELEIVVVDDGSTDHTRDVL